ncbi:MAG: 50S ribosomal protein L9 [SAR202 cluster bacterium]|nr:50S ribosomal protein L9 [SAR202 cluster bacterium]|tara:strand:+ start:16977 stop:17618 length:642 start_codon:yes stop_codon:yes gene_type:complete
MRVVFIEDVEGVALGGEVKEVKNGFARNYLIPKNLAAPATHNNLQRIHKLTKNAATSRTYRLDEMKNLAGTLDGTEIGIEMRAGSNNRLYGSVTGTMVADALAEETGIKIERKLVQLDDPIRDVGTYEVPLRLYSDVNALIKVTVYATGTDPFEMVAQEDEKSDEDKLSPKDSLDDIPEETSNSEVKEDVPVSSVKLEESDTIETESEQDSQE